MVMPDSQPNPQKRCLIKYELDINVYNFGSLRNSIARKHIEIITIKTVKPKRNDNIFHIIDQIKVSMESL